MATYVNTLSRNSPAGGQLAVLFQKTDWTIADFNASGYHWYGANGAVNNFETVNPPFEVWPFSQVQLLVNFQAATGTSPVCQVQLFGYDDPLGQQNCFNWTLGAYNFATGGTASFTTGVSLAAATNYEPTKPLWMRLLVYTSGTFTALGGYSRVSLVGTK